MITHSEAIDLICRFSLASDYNAIYRIISLCDFLYLEVSETTVHEGRYIQMYVFSYNKSRELVFYIFNYAPATDLSKLKESDFKDRIIWF